MYPFIVTIVMADGSRGEHRGNYACGCDAVVAALAVFPLAHRISARRQPA